MNLLKKIFLGRCDDEVHASFVKFGRGIFQDRYLLEAKRQKDKWSVKSSAEFANFLVRECAERAKGKIKIDGAIISTLNIKDDIKFEIKNIKNYMGIKQLIINSEVEPKEIIHLIEKFPKAFFALSFKTEECELKIKAKPPKGAKPSAKGEKKAKADFCSLKTNNRKIIDDLFFDFPEFKEINISHEIEVKEIIFPKGEKDPIKIRELAERKGVVKRKIVVDGSEKISEREFVA